MLLLRQQMTGSFSLDCTIPPSPGYWSKKENKVKIAALYKSAGGIWFFKWIEQCEETQIIFVAVQWSECRAPIANISIFVSKLDCIMSVSAGLGNTG